MGGSASGCPAHPPWIGESTLTRTIWCRGCCERRLAVRLVMSFGRLHLPVQTYYSTYYMEVKLEQPLSAPPGLLRGPAGGPAWWVRRASFAGPSHLDADPIEGTLAGVGCCTHVQCVAVTSAGSYAPPLRLAPSQVLRPPLVNFTDATDSPSTVTTRSEGTPTSEHARLRSELLMVRVRLRECAVWCAGLDIARWNT